MRVTVLRIANRDTYCISRLYIDGERFCDVLEDVDRGLDDSMSEEEILKKKVKGETAIPSGIYPVTITYSPKYKKQMPLINNVKGYSGVRIHSGNYAGFEAFLKKLPINKDKDILSVQEYIDVV